MCIRDSNEGMTRDTSFTERQSGDGQPTANHVCYDVDPAGLEDATPTVDDGSSDEPGSDGGNPPAPNAGP